MYKDSDPLFIPESWDPSNTDNFIEIDNNSKRSYVSLGDEGEWRGKGRGGLSLGADDPAPHEFGHLVGLKDRYTDGKGADPGWSGNIMAESAMSGKPDQRNIDGIVGGAINSYNRQIGRYENAKNGIGDRRANNSLKRTQGYRDYIKGNHTYRTKIDTAFPDN